MAPELGRIGPLTIRTYTLFLDAAIIIGLLLMAWFGWQRDERPARWVDAGLLAIIGGLIVGRLGHVAIHWSYFSSQLIEVPQVWRGGLNWHGAVLGGVVTLWIYHKQMQVSWVTLLEAAALILPIGALFVYTGCLMVSCGHGAEVITLADYPPLIAAELPDLYGVVAPRLTSQGYGVALSILLLLSSLGLAGVLQPRGLRFWIVLGLLSLGTFGIGFTRGDEVPMVGILRLDQVLDLLMALAAFVSLFFTWRSGRVEQQEAKPTSKKRVLGAYNAD